MEYIFGTMITPIKKPMIYPQLLWMKEFMSISAEKESIIDALK